MASHGGAIPSATERRSKHESRVNRAIVDKRGRVTIPRRLRETLGIRRGTELRFGERDGELVAVVLPTDPIDALVGLGDAANVDRTLDDLRGSGYDRDLDGR